MSSRTRTLNRLDFPEKRVIALTCPPAEGPTAPPAWRPFSPPAVRTVVGQNPSVEVVCPVHLSPVVQDCAHRLLGDHPRIHLIAPLDVAQMHNLMARSYLVLTDSGGLRRKPRTGQTRPGSPPGDGTPRGHRRRHRKAGRCGDGTHHRSHPGGCSGERLMPEWHMR
ncbi:MAG: UDP-N-acetylglucosamine 2-epimerase [Oscillospiraceae bacterium]